MDALLVCIGNRHIQAPPLPSYTHDVHDDKKSKKLIQADRIPTGIKDVHSRSSKDAI
jgi:hypothetical protein